MNKYQDKRLFGGNREVAIQRDGERCVMCGLTRVAHKEKYGRDITVDHKDGLGVNAIVKNNNLDNLQTLCSKCHGEKDIQRQIDGVRGVRKLSDQAIAEIKGWLKNRSSITKIAEHYKVSRLTIYRIRDEECVIYKVKEP